MQYKIHLDFRLTNYYLLNYSITERTSLSIKLRPLYFLPFFKLVQDWLLVNFTHHSECFEFPILTLLFYLELSYFNLVMSYILFSEYSREIVLFSITYIASYLLDMGYRLIAHCAVYCDYDNSSILLSDNICTLSSIDFYIFFNYITIIKKQPSKSILLADYLSDNSMTHDIVFIHMVKM